MTWWRISREAVNDKYFSNVKPHPPVLIIHPSLTWWLYWKWIYFMHVTQICNALSRPLMKPSMCQTIDINKWLRPLISCCVLQYPHSSSKYWYFAVDKHDGISSLFDAWNHTYEVRTRPVIGRVRGKTVHSVSSRLYVSKAGSGRRCSGPSVFFAPWKKPLILQIYFLYQCCEPCDETIYYSS